MVESIKLDVLTPMGPKRESVEVPGVEVPSTRGEMGLLPHHEALITELTPGIVRFRENNEDIRIAVGGGFAEVKPSGRVILLVERAQEAKDVDVEATRKQLTEVAAKLYAYEGPITDPEPAALEREQAWLIALLRVAGASEDFRH